MIQGTVTADREPIVRIVVRDGVEFDKKIT